MKKEELEELKKLREEKELQELEALRKWKESQELPKFETEGKEVAAVDPDKVAKDQARLQEHLNQQLLNNPVLKNLVDQFRLQQQPNTAAMPMPPKPPVYPGPAPEPIKDTGKAKLTMVNVREAALDIKKHLQRNNTLFFLGIGVTFVSLAVSMFNIIAGGGVMIVGMIPMALIYKANVQEIKRLETTYGV